MLDEFDDLDKKRIAAKKFDFIGVKPLVDTNRPQTKEEKALEEKRAIFELLLKRHIKKSVNTKEKKKKLFRRQQLLNKTQKQKNTAK